MLNQYLSRDIKDASRMDDQIEMADIAEIQIPKGRYYLPFTMCLISLKSHKYQFLRILDKLYKNYT